MTTHRVSPREYTKRKPIDLMLGMSSSQFNNKDCRDYLVQNSLTGGKKGMDDDNIREAAQKRMDSMTNDSHGMFLYSSGSQKSGSQKKSQKKSLKKPVLSKTSPKKKPKVMTHTYILCAWLSNVFLLSLYRFQSPAGVLRKVRVADTLTREINAFFLL